MSETQRIVCRQCRVHIANRRTSFLGFVRVIATADGEIVEGDKRECVVKCKLCKRTRTVTL